MFKENLRNLLEKVVEKIKCCYSSVQQSQSGCELGGLKGCETYSFNREGGGGESASYLAIGSDCPFCKGKLDGIKEKGHKVALDITSGQAELINFVRAYGMIVAYEVPNAEYCYICWVTHDDTMSGVQQSTVDENPRRHNSGFGVAVCDGQLCAN